MSLPRADIYLRALRLGARPGGPGSLGINAALARLHLDALVKERSGEAAAVWSSPLVPSEILASFGLSSVTPETVSAVLASAGLGGELLGRAEALSLSGDCCSFQRAAVAALEDGLVPVPSAFLSTGPICDDNPKMADHLSRRFGRPYFLLDVPAGSDRAALDYLLGQLGELVGFLEELTGRRFRPDRLAEAVGRSNRARAAWVEVNALRRDHPPVMHGAAALRLAGGLLLQKLGFPGLAEAMEAHAAELRQRLAAGASVPARHRLLWLHLFPLHDREFMRFIETGLGAVVVFEESSLVWWEAPDPVDPLPGLAARMLGSPLAGPLDRRVAAIEGMIRDYRPGGVVNFSHQGCKSLTGGVPLVARACRRAGVPLLDLSGDCLDNRGTATAPWRTRLEAFVEMLGN